MVKTIWRTFRRCNWTGCPAIFKLGTSRQSPFKLIELKIYIRFKNIFLNTVWFKVGQSEIVDTITFLEVASSRKKVKLTEYTQRNLFKILSNQTEIRLYLTFLIDLEQQTDVRLVSNQSGNTKLNQISVWFNKTWRRFLPS